MKKMLNQPKRLCKHILHAAVIVLVSVFMLYLVLPRLFFYLSEVEWIQNIILCELQEEPPNGDAQTLGSPLMSQNTYTSTRAEVVRSLWGSITVPILSLIVTFCFTYITYSHQKKMEQEEKKKEHKEWLERYFHALWNDHVKISEDFNHDCVMLTKENISNKKGSWGFILPQPRKLPADATVTFESVSTEFYNEQINTDSYNPINREQTLRKTMEFALFVDEAAYNDIATFALSANLNLCFTITIKMKVGYDDDAYEATVKYVLKKRSVFIDDENGPQIQAFVSDTICTAK